MENFYLMDLISAVNGSFILGNPHLPITGIEIDTRTIKKGQLFFALKGKKDGHEYIKEAIEKGVSAIVYSKDNVDFNLFYPNLPSLVKVRDTSVALENLAAFYRRKFNNLKVIDVTGSNGKTTTKEMLASILRQRGNTLSNEGNFNNRIGVPLTIFNLTSDIEYAALEIGTSEFGEIKTLANMTKPFGGIITNIGSSHLEFFKTPQNVLKEKSSLIDGLDNNGFIVLNNDNIYLKNYIPHISKKVITFGLYSGADVYAKNIRLWLDKPMFDLYIDSQFETIELPIKGKFNIFNALAAAAAAYGMGFSINEIKKGLKHFSPPKMRMQSYVLKNGATIINDAYNANPSSMKESITSLAQSYPNKEVTLVLGDMLELGDNAAQYHAEIGKFINTQPNIKNVYLFGSLVSNIKNELTKKRARYFMTKIIICEELMKEMNENTLIFIKGSRRMHLDAVYDELIAMDKLKKD